MTHDQAGVSGAVIVHVIPFDQPRGAQRYARALVDALAPTGHEHLLLTLFRGDATTLEADVSLDVPRGVLRRLGVDPRAVWGLRRELRRIRPDVVVAHGGEPAKYLALAIPRETKLVYLKIGTGHPGMSRAVSAMAHRFYTGRSDVIVAVSEAAAEEMRDLMPALANRVRVIPNGRDPAVFQPGRADDRPGPLRLAWIGQIDQTKRPEWFIELVRAIKDENREVEAVLVGDGPRRAELARAAETAGVEMTGRRDDVPEILSGADLLVFTGKPPEGMPGVLIEAGLAGIPVVSTRVPGASDVIVDGRTGILVGLDDFEGMVQAVRDLLDDPSRRRSMGAAARARCTDEFSLEATVSRWNEVFNDLVTEEGRPG